MKRFAPLAVAAVMILAALNVLASAATPAAPCSEPACGGAMKAPSLCSDPGCMASVPCSNPSCD